MKKLSLISALITFILFFVLYFMYETPLFIAFDEACAKLVAGNKLLIFFHYFGEPVFYLSVALVLLFWQWKKKNYVALVFIGITIFLGNGLNQVLKRWVERPRPEIENQLLSYSFPSGHSMAAVLYLLITAYLLTENLQNQKYKLLIWLVAILLLCFIGVARIAESRHFATDVLAGWSAGYTWFIICMLWYKWRKNH